MRVHLPRRALSTVKDWRTAPSGKNGIVGSFLFPVLIPSVYGFKSNLKTLKVQDEILGNILDTVA
jgi:hypothetical protein